MAFFIGVYMNHIFRDLHISHNINCDPEDPMSIINNDDLLKKYTPHRLKVFALIVDFIVNNINYQDACVFTNLLEYDKIVDYLQDKHNITHEVYYARSYLRDACRVNILNDCTKSLKLTRKNNGTPPRAYCKGRNYDLMYNFLQEAMK